MRIELNGLETGGKPLYFVLTDEAPTGAPADAVVLSLDGPQAQHAVVDNQAPSISRAKLREVLEERLAPAVNLDNEVDIVVRTFQEYTASLSNSVSTAQNMILGALRHLHDVDVEEDSPVGKAIRVLHGEPVSARLA